MHLSPGDMRRQGFPSPMPIEDAGSRMDIEIFDEYGSRIPEEESSDDDINWVEPGEDDYSSKDESDDGTWDAPFASTASPCVRVPGAPASTASPFVRVPGAPCQPMQRLPRLWECRQRLPRVRRVMDHPSECLSTLDLTLKSPGWAVTFLLLQSTFSRWCPSWRPSCGQSPRPLKAHGGSKDIFWHCPKRCCRL